MRGQTDPFGQPRRPSLPGLTGSAPRPAGDPREEGDEAACRAFGFLRGQRDRALMVEFRLATGDTVAFPYNLLGPIRYNPSTGLLLRFAGDVVTLVLIRGSNLAAAVDGGSVNLTDRGLHRHRVVWVREMDVGEVAAAGRSEPTVDAIVVAEFDTPAAASDWIRRVAPAFAGRSSGSAGSE
jgi:hypothetical protein